ncbi:MAG: LysM peptidoglycan-binding domain-containing protein [Gammaproteobacteria bacterium]|nr:LysM peptidoglycan-binding domain-containing protein [Gammaproteobacteria bacterium]
MISKGRLSGSRGTFVGDPSGAVVRGGGMRIYYDEAGQRREVIHENDVKERYTYSPDGWLENTYITQDVTDPNAFERLASQRAVDAQGRTALYLEYDSTGATMTDTRSFYDKDGRLMKEISKTGTTNYYYYQGDSDSKQSSAIAQVMARPASDPSASGQLARMHFVPDGTKEPKALEFKNHYTYEYWDSAKQKEITKEPYVKEVSGWAPGFTSLWYNVNGHLLQAIDMHGHASYTYVSNATGLTLERSAKSVLPNEQPKTVFTFYYYVAGRRVGDVSTDPTARDRRISYAEHLAQWEKNGGKASDRSFKNLSPVTSSDFDQNYEPINAQYPAATGSTYTARGGESLQEVARTLWGDALMWYLIAEANGLRGTERLLAGQVLVIPNKVTNIHNSAETFRPYNPGEVIGNIDPTLPAPPSQKDCGLKQILIIIIVVVVTIYAAGVAAQFMGLTAPAGAAAGVGSVGMATLGGSAVATGGAIAGTLGVTATSVLAAAVGAAVGSAVGQLAGMAMGLQDEFSWKQVGLAALGAGVTAGVGAGANALSNAGRVAATTGQSASTLQRAGQWYSQLNPALQAGTRAAVASAVTQGLRGKWSWREIGASAVGAAAGHQMSEQLSKSGELAKSLGQVGIGTLSGSVGGSLSQAIATGRVDPGAVFFSSLGNAIGNSIVGEMTRGPETQLPEAVAREAENNPAVAALYRKAVENFRAGGIGEDKAQELALRGFGLRNSAGDAQALDAYKLDVLVAKGASADSAQALLNYMGLATSQAEPPVPVALSADDFGGSPDLVLPTVTITGARGSGLSATGQFLNDWQDELAAVGSASQKLGQWMDDNPVLGWGLMAVQAATTPLLFAGQQALQHSPIGERLNALTGAAFEAASNFVDSEGAIGDAGKAALMTIGGISALSLAVGGLSMLRNSVNTASVLARDLERRRIEMNASRDGGVDPHVVDPRVLAQQRLGQMQQQFSSLMAKGDAHFLTKHGPQTTLAQQYERASVGWPDKNGKLTTADASRFFNPEDMEDAMRRAMVEFKTSPQKSIEVPMGKPIGEGFMRTGALPDYRQSSIVRVNFDMQTGLPYTAFPDIVRNGVTLPVPKF